MAGEVRRPAVFVTVLIAPGHSGRRRGNGVDATSVPRVASCEPPHHEPAAAGRPVHPDGLDGVGGARGIEAAGLTVGGGHQHLPGPEHRQQSGAHHARRPAGEQGHGAGSAAHRGPPARSRADPPPPAAGRSRRRTASRSAANPAETARAAAGWARITSRVPSGSEETRSRARCRRRRLVCARTTAGPTARDTTNPTRGGDDESTSRHRCPTRVDRPQRRPRRTACAKSRPRRIRCRAGSMAPPPRPGQAESSARPLRRRAERMARPARVRMRSRKPWVFARRRLFGWNVRLLTRKTPRSCCQGFGQGWRTGSSRPVRAIQGGARTARLAGLGCRDVANLHHGTAVRVSRSNQPLAGRPTVVQLSAYPRPARLRVGRPSRRRLRHKGCARAVVTCRAPRVHAPKWTRYVAGSCCE